MSSVFEFLPEVEYERPWESKEHPVRGEGRKLWWRRKSQLPAGLLGLGLGTGGRDRAAGTFNRWSGILQNPMGRALLGIFGIRPGYEKAEGSIRKGLELSHPGPLPKDFYGQVVRDVTQGPFEDERGVLGRLAGGYGAGDRSKIFHWAMTKGLLPEVREGMSPEARREALSKLSYYAQAARALQEVGGGDVVQNLEQLARGGLIGKVAPGNLEHMVRMHQIQKNLRTV